MDKAKILRLCNEIEDIATEIKERTMKNSYFMAQTIINKVILISAEITAPPKSNADRIRQMTDEELAEMIVRGSICDMCNAHCDAYKTPEDCVHSVCAWLKQEVSEDAKKE